VAGVGALIEEAVCGANGLGTALAEGEYVEVFGPEHFILGFHAHTCLGIPLRDTEGAVVGALGVSGKRPDDAPRLREILVSAAHAIEMELAAARLEEDMARVLAAQHAPLEPLERLLGDILQAQASVRLRLESAADQLAHHRLTHARDLLELAATVLHRFRRQAALWRGLALEETSAPRPVALDTALRELVELLEAEAAGRQVALVFHAIEPVVIDADPQALSRALLRALLGGIETARGGVLCVDLLRVPEGGSVSLTPIPGPGVTSAAPAPLRLVAPSIQAGP
jgi:transcriptional regulator of acetoin/glycerol metabolism